LEEGLRGRTLRYGRSDTAGGKECKRTMHKQGGQSRAFLEGKLQGGGLFQVLKRSLRTRDENHGKLVELKRKRARLLHSSPASQPQPNLLDTGAEYGC